MSQARQPLSVPSTQIRVAGRRLRFVHPSVVFKAGSGAVLNDEAHQQREDSRERLERATKEIAALLAAAGKPMTRLDPGASLLGLETGLVVSAEERWANQLVLPAVQVVQRRRDLGELMAFLEGDLRAGRYTRMAVVTAGPRCKIDDLPDQWERLWRNLRKFRRAVLRFKGEMVSTSIELAIDAAGSIHLHAHVLYLFRRTLGSDGFTAFLERVHERIEDRVHDCGVLQDPAEAVKYSVKYGISWGEEEATGKPETLEERCQRFIEATEALTGRVHAAKQPQDHLMVRLAGILYRRNLFVPYDAFKAFRQALRAEKLRPWKAPNGQVVLTRSYDVASKPEEHEDEPPDPMPPLENWVRAVSRPRTLPGSPVIEPVLSVIGYTAKPTTKSGVKRLEWIEGLKAKLLSGAGLGLVGPRSMPPINPHQAQPGGSPASPGGSASATAPPAPQSQASAGPGTGPSIVHTRTLNRTSTMPPRGPAAGRRPPSPPLPMGP